MADKKTYDVQNPEATIYSWFLFVLNEEIKKIVLESYQPNLILYTKYKIQDKRGAVVTIMTAYGDIKVIHDPDMEELMKIEVG